MSSAIQLPIDKCVPCRGVLNPRGFFSVLGQLGLDEVANYWVHPGSHVLGTEDPFLLLDTQVVKLFYRQRDKTIYVIPRG